VNSESGSRYAYAMLAAVSVAWGGAIVAGKFIVGDVPPFTVGGIRNLLTLVMLFFLLMRKEGLLLPPGRDWPILFAIGLFGPFGGNALFYVAMQHTSAINGGLITSASPLIITLLSFFVLKERITLFKTLGIALSFLGVIVVITKGSWSVLSSMDLNVGDMIMLGNPISLAIATVLIKKVVGRYSPLALGVYTQVAACIAFFAVYGIRTDNNSGENTSFCCGYRSICVSGNSNGVYRGGLVEQGN